MPGVACVGVDAAGGTQLGLQGANFKVDGNPIVLLGDHVAPHSPFEPPHVPDPTMAQGSPNFRLNGIPVCREGHVATCGHPTTGRPKFRIP
ncbi:PAAR domain-containing protein [Microvirga brassicacearum]